MKNETLLLTIMILVILAEVTYLVIKLPRQNLGRRQGRPIFIDTSVLIDGRIIAVAKSGFIGDTLVIPRSVIGELQFLADNADHEKRARARHGLDVVSDLQGMPEVDVEILQDGSKAEEGVDERLLKLAKKRSGAICTIDYNLNKVAVVEGIAVLNVNELAQSLRMAYLPGEKILLELVQKGQDSHQAVGYLTDGTMVVIEHANKYIGQTVEVEFIRSLQTAAGKMMFARRVEKQAVAQQPVVQLKQQSKSIQPKGRAPKQAAPESDAVPSSTTFHSDPKEQARSISKRTGRTPKTQHTTSNQPNERSIRQRRDTRKPRTSADREAAFIDLVEKS